MASIERNDYPFPSHFCGSTHCKYGKTTTVGKYVISTVGDYYPPYHNGTRAVVGCDRYYETYVFKGWHLCQCDECKYGNRRVIVEDYDQINSLSANTKEEADAAHETMVAMYLNEP